MSREERLNVARGAQSGSRQVQSAPPDVHARGLRTKAIHYPHLCFLMYASVMTLISAMDSLLTRLDDLIHSERLSAQVRFALHQAVTNDREADIATVVPVFVLAFTCLAYGLFVALSSSFDEPTVRPAPTPASPPGRAEETSESDVLSATALATPSGGEDCKDKEGERIKRIPRSKTRQP